MNSAALGFRRNLSHASVDPALFCITLREAVHARVDLRRMWPIFYIKHLIPGGSADDSSAVVNTVLVRISTSDPEGYRRAPSRLNVLLSATRLQSKSQLRHSSMTVFFLPESRPFVMVSEPERLAFRSK